MDESPDISNKTAGKSHWFTIVTSALSGSLLLFLSFFFLLSPFTFWYDNSSEGFTTCFISSKKNTRGKTTIPNNSAIFILLIFLKFINIIFNSSTQIHWLLVLQQKKQGAYPFCHLVQPGNILAYPFLFFQFHLT